MKIKKHLHFTALRKKISKRINQIKDFRQKEKVKHILHDCIMSGLAMMFYQDPSLLQFQRRLQESIHQNNLNTLFQVKSIPKDTQMRDVLDELDTKELEPLLGDLFRPLQRGKYLEQYQVLDKYYIVSIDGSGYFSSEKIECAGCLHKENKQGKIRYEHQIVQAALMHPDLRQVIPLAPEEISNTDGREKQDCEINAGKRLIDKIRTAHPKLKTVITADSLLSKQPFLQKLKEKNMRYVLVVKEKDHKVLMEWVNEHRQMGEISRIEARDAKGRFHVYEWINNMPLNGNKDTVWVNYFEYWIKDKKGDKVNYHNSWVTDFAIDDKNVRELVRIGRCKWKIENETFNTLKNQGYHLEHNFGHGKKHLSMNFFILNLLAFFMHQIFELTDKLYQACREHFGSKRNLWDHLRVSIRILVFPDWDILLRRILRPSDFL